MVVFWLEIQVVQSILEMAMANEGLCRVLQLDGVFIEFAGEIVIAQLTDGQEVARAKGRECMSVCSKCGQFWERESAGVCGLHDTAVGETNVDSNWDRHMVCCGSSQSHVMAGAAGVNDCIRGGVYGHRQGFGCGV